MGLFDYRQPVRARRLMLRFVYLFRFERGCQVKIHEPVALFAMYRTVVLANRVPSVAPRKAGSEIGAAYSTARYVSLSPGGLPAS